MNTTLQQVLQLVTIQTAPKAMTDDTANNEIGNVRSLIPVDLADLDRKSLERIVFAAYRLGTEHCHRTMGFATEGDDLLTLAEMERRAVVRAFGVAQGNVRTAASLLGIGKTAMYRKLHQYRILDGRSRRCPNCGYDPFSHA